MDSLAGLKSTSLIGIIGMEGIKLQEFILCLSSLSNHFLNDSNLICLLAN